MINQKSISAVNKSKFGSHFVKPLTQTYCFSQIPNTIKSLFNIKTSSKLPEDTTPKSKNQKVLFLFIDSFGWKFLEKHYTKYPFLARFYEKGVVSKLTSQFPSTTSVHVTTIHTGLPVGESGIYEWFYYEPKADAIIAPLLFSFAGDKAREGLRTTNLEPKDIFPSTTLYKDLASHGVQSYIFQYKDYTPSAFSDVVFEGATEIYPYRTLAHSLTLLQQTINNTNGPAYFFYYYDPIDGAGHNEGPDSPVHLGEIDNFFTAIENLFYQKLENKEELTILLSADHGMAHVSPQTTYFLNEEVPEIIPMIKKNKQGALLVPAGSCRDMFLYINDSQVDEALALLKKNLAGKAEVYKTDELIKNGFFGPQVTEEFKNRVGNIVILSYPNRAVWWREIGKFDQLYFGHHGGLTPEEMEIPFLYL